MPLVHRCILNRAYWLCCSVLRLVPTVCRPAAQPAKSGNRIFDLRQERSAERQNLVRIQSDSSRIPANRHSSVEARRKVLEPAIFYGLQQLDARPAARGDGCERFAPSDSGSSELFLHRLIGHNALHMRYRHLGRGALRQLLRKPEGSRDSRFAGRDSSFGTARDDPGRVEGWKSARSRTANCEPRAANCDQ